MGTTRKTASIAWTLLCLLFCWPVACAQAATAAPNLSTATLGMPPPFDAKIVVYINWDGFAKYYMDLAEAQGKIPTLSRIRTTDGVFFANAYTGIPSITNPMQAAIASGTTPRFTDNHYRYFDKKLNKVVQEQPARKNEAETLAEAAIRQGVNTLSINQFAFLERGSSFGQPSKIYLNASVGANGYSDNIARFDEAIRQIKNLHQGGIIDMQKPLLIALYMDDLDAIGHNMGSSYGHAPVKTEADRQQAVVERLSIMDAILGEFIQICQETGLYERMSFLLTADHGMATMGLQQSIFDDSIYSKLPDLLSIIEALGPGYKCEVLTPGSQETPSAETDIAVVTVGLQVQLSHIGEDNPAVIEEKNIKIATALQKVGYIDRFMFPWEMIARGVKAGFADLIISPQTPYHFRPAHNGLTMVRGQHDSLADDAQRISALMWGNGIKKGVTYHGKVYNEDFAPTLAQLLNINAPLDATGRVIYEVLDGVAPPVERAIIIEDQAVMASGKARRLMDDEASGGTAINLPGKYAGFELKGRAARSVIVRFSARSDSRLQLWVNGRFIRTLFFPASNGLSSKYDDKKINITLNQGDTIRLVTETTDEEGINIDCLRFIQ